MDMPSKRAYVQGLLVACPYEANPETCVLYEIRKKPLKERTAWLRELDDSQIQGIIITHQKCSVRRESELKLAKE
jgi:hypothetical protein